MIKFINAEIFVYLLWYHVGLKAQLTPVATDTDSSDDFLKNPKKSAYLILHTFT